MEDPIDAWPVVTAGLTIRTALCLRRAGIRTVGELRQLPDEKLLAIPGLAAGLLHNVHWFCDRVRQLAVPPADLPAWLDEFLTPLQRTVIEQRCGLTDPPLSAGVEACHAPGSGLGTGAATPSGTGLSDRNGRAAPAAHAAGAGVGPTLAGSGGHGGARGARTGGV